MDNNIVCSKCDKTFKKPSKNGIINTKSYICPKCIIKICREDNTMTKRRLTEVFED